jgi:metal-sulfur cluster biosynthetic enzyme
VTRAWRRTVCPTASGIPARWATTGRPTMTAVSGTPSDAPDWALRALSGVYDPCCRDKGISVVDMGLLRSVTVADGHARVELLLTSGWCPFAARVLSDVEEAIRAQPGVGSCEVAVVWDEVWTPDRLAESAVRKLRFLPDPVAVPDRETYLSAHRDQTGRTP